MTFERETLEKQLGREPTMDEIAGEAGLSRREVTALLCSMPGPELIQGTFFQPGHLRLTDADLLRHLHLGLAPEIA